MIWRRRRRRDEFTEEIGQHLELERTQLLSEGLSSEEATRAARSRFGSLTAATERFHEATRLSWLDHVAQDVRSALRSLRKYPVAASVTVLSIAGGIGSTTAMLVVRDAVFIKPPPLYEAPDRLSLVDVARPERPRGSVPLGLYRLWEGDQGLGLAVAAATGEASIDVRTGNRERTVAVRSVTADFFELLGVRPLVGRTFRSLTPASADQHTAVLSYGIWQTLFDGRPDVLGEHFEIGDRTYDVIGVMPERFYFASMRPTIWTFLDPAAAGAEDRVQVVARRAAGLSPAGLQEQLERDVPFYVQQLPESERQLRARVWPVAGTPLGNQMAVATPWVFAVAVLLTLVIACANVAILIFAQWTAREREIAIRASLGAGRSRIVRLLLTESIVVATLGGVLGVCVTFMLRGLIVHRAGEALALYDLTIDPVVLLKVAAVTVLAGVATGIGPALIETRGLQAHPLRAITSERVRQRWRHALVALEVSVTVALLVVTATLVDSYRRQLSLDLGFSTQGLVSVRVENDSGIPIQRILDVIETTPEVRAVAAASTVPLSGTGPFQAVSTDANGSNTVSSERVLAGPDFFETLGVTMRAGRSFLSTDTLSGPEVAVVNETLAHRLFPISDAIGERVWIDRQAFAVVGVVADHATIGVRQFRPGVYLPLQESAATKRIHFIVRTSGEPSRIVSVLRREIGRAGNGNRVTAANPLDQVIITGRQETLAGTVPLIPLFSMGLFLTAAGIYGVLSFAITRRAGELATRAAIGATGWDLLRLVTAHTARLIVLGSALAVAVTFGLTRLVRAAGGGGSPFDTPSWHAFVVPVVIVSAVGAVAIWMASRRVLQINAALFLRAE